MMEGALLLCVAFCWAGPGGPDEHRGELEAALDSWAADIRDVRSADLRMNRYTIDEFGHETVLRVRARYRRAGGTRIDLGPAAFGDIEFYPGFRRRANAGPPTSVRAQSLVSHGDMLYWVEGGQVYPSPAATSLFRPCFEFRSQPVEPFILHWKQVREGCEFSVVRTTDEHLLVSAVPRPGARLDGEKFPFKAAGMVFSRPVCELEGVFVRSGDRDSWTQLVDARINLAGRELDELDRMFATFPVSPPAIAEKPPEPCRPSGLRTWVELVLVVLGLYRG